MPNYIAQDINISFVDCYKEILIILMKKIVMNKWDSQPSIKNYNELIYFALWYEEYPTETKSPVIPHHKKLLVLLN